MTTLSPLLAIVLLALALPAGAESDPFAALAPHAPLRPDPALSREVILSGGGAAHFACESADRNLRAYQGLYVKMHEYLDSWQSFVGRREYLASDASKIEVWPFALRRSYDDGTVEEVFLPAERNALLITMTPGQDGPGLFRPWVDMRHIWQPGRNEYRTEWNERLGALFIYRENFEPSAGVPRVIALIPGEGAEWRAEPRDEKQSYPRDAARKAMGEATPHSPGRFAFDAEAGWAFRVAVGLGEDEREAFAAARELLDNERRIFAELAGRYPNPALLDLLDAPGRPGKAEPPTIHGTALVWARWSLSNLTMDARGPGIYAGYHWFSNYWGRDSFISLPGACLVNGQFELARSILLSFAEHQLIDENNARLGRLPNIVNPDNLQYAGVDGTWWWVRAARLYLDYSGDREFIALARPVVERAVAGALAKAVDEHGLLRHGDGETWMDAGGEANPFSPRGDRAVEVQVLWWDGLRTAALLAEWDGDQEAAAAHRATANRVHDAILRLFPRGDGLGLADHLNPDGSQDRQLRPNQIFALTLPRRNDPEDGPENWWGKELAAEILDAVVDHCVLPHGVTSLAPSDPAWIPRHLDLDDHYYDEAYHNGDVWLWLSGPVIQALCDAGRQDEAWTMLEPLTKDLLERGAVGTMREIRDGEARDLEDFGGATSQAWSLAEYLRVHGEAFLGWHPRLMAQEVYLRPRIPADVEELEGGVWLEGCKSTKIGFGQLYLTQTGVKLGWPGHTSLTSSYLPPKAPEYLIHIEGRDGRIREETITPRGMRQGKELSW
jgi:glycogen debranching enzyme